MILQCEMCGTKFNRDEIYSCPVCKHGKPESGNRNAQTVPITDAHIEVFMNLFCFHDYTTEEAGNFVGWKLNYAYTIKKIIWGSKPQANIRDLEQSLRQ